jgi:hypothetical protein
MSSDNVKVLVPITTISRIVVFVHPGELRNGCVHLVCNHDGHGVDVLEGWMGEYRKSGALCLYDGPPQQLRVG